MTTNVRPFVLEVIATSLADAVAAREGGANRVELVSDLARGGMTPAVDLVDAVCARAGVAVRVMLRETEAHQVDDPRTRTRILRLARELAARPLDGVVLGFLRGARIDDEFAADVAEACAHRVTFHRAFEAVSDHADAMARLSRLAAVDRLLASGGPGDWPARAARLAEWARRAEPRIALIVGGGVSAALLPDVMRVPGVREIHVGRAVRRDGTVEGPVAAKDVAALRARLDQAGP